MDEVKANNIIALNVPLLILFLHVE